MCYMENVRLGTGNQGKLHHALNKDTNQQNPLPDTTKQTLIATSGTHSKIEAGDELRNFLPQPTPAH